MSRNHSSFGVHAIAFFYLVGMAVVFMAMFTNQEMTGRQLATIHGLPGLPPLVAFALTLLMGGLVVAGLSWFRRWGYWVTLGYMAYLLFMPPLMLGSQSVSVFANIVWPLFVVVYLVCCRKRFGEGLPRNV